MSTSPDYADDRVTIASPEGIDISLVVVGIGSRFIAVAIDTAIQIVVYVALAFTITLLGANDGGAWVFTLIVALLFMVQFGYFIVIETLMRGRTPGKAVAGLRVVRTDGTAITFRDSAIRNIVRVVDSLPTFYLVGMGASALSARNQRLGDMAAGTLVVRETRRATAPTSGTPAVDPQWAAYAERWDISRVDRNDTAALRSFFDRAPNLAAEAHDRVATQLRAAVGPKVGGADTAELTDEQFLAAVLAAKEAGGSSLP